jgi:hypothetical protein
MDREEVAQILKGISRQIDMGIKDSEFEDNFNGSTFDMTFDRFPWPTQRPYKLRARIIVTETPIHIEVCQTCSNEKVACVCMGEDDNESND